MSLPVYVGKRCPLVPVRFTRLRCWTGCVYWDKAGKRCKVEQSEEWNPRTGRGRGKTT